MELERNRGKKKRKNKKETKKTNKQKQKHKISDKTEMVAIKRRKKRGATWEQESMDGYYGWEVNGIEVRESSK